MPGGRLRVMLKKETNSAQNFKDQLNCKPFSFNLQKCFSLLYTLIKWGEFQNKNIYTFLSFLPFFLADAIHWIQPEVTSIYVSLKLSKFPVLYKNVTWLYFRRPLLMLGSKPNHSVNRGSPTDCSCWQSNPFMQPEQLRESEEGLQSSPCSLQLWLNFIANTSKTGAAAVRILCFENMTAKLIGAIFCTGEEHFQHTKRNSNHCFCNQRN